MGPDGQRLHSAFHVHGDHAHHDEHEHLSGQVATVERIADDVRVLRTARLGLTDHPVLTWRPSTATAAWTMGTTPDAVADRDATRLLVQVLREMAEQPAPEPVRVGLLGYGAIGHEHSRAVRAVDGLTLTAVCDTSQERLHHAEAAAPGVATTTSAEALLERDDVDLVVVSTPPSTHATWALRAIAAGRHVVVEKPFAIRTAEADEVLAAAADAQLLAVVYQNRRFDPDHLAVRRMVDRGDLGEVFHIETFVGGYGHPCNLWHSDEGVSGGAFYDWGSHLLDQVLDLVPTQIEHVTAASHKRHWFDVTNADHSRVTVRFVDGVEAEFTHSDLAAAHEAPVVRPGDPWGHRRQLALGADRVPQRHRHPRRGCAGPGGLPARARAARGRRQRHPGGRTPRPRPPVPPRAGRQAAVRAADDRHRRAVAPRAVGHGGGVGVRCRPRPSGGPAVSGPARSGGGSWAPGSSRPRGWPRPCTRRTARCSRLSAPATPSGRPHSSPSGAVGSYAEVCARDDVDAVYVSLPNNDHLHWVQVALEAGKHVLCEKPLGMDAGEVAVMRSAAERTGLLLVEAAWNRWHPRTRRIEALVAPITEPRDVRAWFTFPGVPGGQLPAGSRPRRRGAARCRLLHGVGRAGGPLGRCGGRRRGRAAPRPDRGGPDHRPPS